MRDATAVEASVMEDRMVVILAASGPACLVPLGCWKQPMTSGGTAG
jgi:hypothetical protein